MKRTKIIYWISTIAFAGLMLFSAVPDILSVPDAVKFITDLGYPVYFITFIGVAKLLGCIAILIPGFPRIKEWAYAGLFFDLIAAVYSFIAKAGFNPQMLGMLMFIVPGIISYIYFQKMMKLKAVTNP